jgi:hypothetical protein
MLCLLALGQLELKVTRARLTYPLPVRESQISFRTTGGTCRQGSNLRPNTVSQPNLPSLPVLPGQPLLLRNVVTCRA